MAVSNPAVGITAAFADTSGIHTGNMNSSIRIVLISVTEVHCMVIRLSWGGGGGGKPITVSTGGITGQGENRAAVQGESKPSRFGRSGPSIQQSCHPTPTWGTQPAFLHWPSPTIHGIPESTKEKAW